MVAISPAYHLDLPAHGTWVPLGLAQTDLPELASVLVTTYDFKSPNFGQVSGDIVLTVLHLPTMTHRRTVIPSAVPTAMLQYGPDDGRDTVLYAARPIGGGRVLLWYGRTTERGLGRSPYYLRVLDASQRELVLGPAVEIVQLSEGWDGSQGQGWHIVIPGETVPGDRDSRDGFFLGNTTMGVHRSAPYQYTAVWPVITQVEDHYAVRTEDHFAEVGFATRNFTVEGTTITVDQSPWRVQARTRVHPPMDEDYPSEVIWDEFGRTHWVDEPTVTNALVSDWIWAWHSTWFMLRWDGTQITGVTHHRLKAASSPNDNGLSMGNTYGNTPKVREGVLRTYSMENWWSDELHRIVAARPGQRPIPAQTHAMGSGSSLHFDSWVASDHRHPTWGEPGHLAAALFSYRREWGDPALTYDWTNHSEWQLGVMLGPYRAMIPGSRQMQIPGAGLDWVQDLFHYTTDTQFYLGEVASLRSGYIVATCWRLPWNPTSYGSPEWYPPPATGRVGLSVWSYPAAMNLETGEHRSRGHFS